MARVFFHKIFGNVLRNYSGLSDQPKTAGIIVIGDEILKGDVSDTNSQFMCKKLHALGVVLGKISVIGDNVNEIAEEVKCFSEKFKFVITSGGIGPTHDDVTYEGVAKAFGESLHFHPELVEICSNFYRTTDTNQPGMKLALVPKSAVLTYGVDKEKGLVIKYPNVSVRNVYMFPGIPQLLEKSFAILSEGLFRSQQKFYRKHIYLNLREHQIVKTLDLLIHEFPQICVGSYPKMDHGSYKVKITIESTEENHTNKAYEKLLKMIPPDAVVDMKE